MYDLVRLFLLIMVQNIKLSYNILIHMHFVLCVSITITNCAKCHTYNAILMKIQIINEEFY